MEALVGIFNDREIASISWIGVLVICVILNQKFRKSLIRLFAAFFPGKIIVVYWLMFFYICQITIWLSLVNLWNLSLLKNTIYWFFGTALVMLFNFAKAQSDRNYFKNTAINSIKIMVFIEFVINLYVFNLLIEIAILPIIVGACVILAVAETDPKHAILQKFLNVLLSTVGFVFIAYSFSMAIFNFQNFVTVQHLKELLVPPLLTVFFLPFIYSLALFSAYENLFNKIDIGVSRKSKEAAKLLKKKILLICNINLRKLLRFSKEAKVWSVSNPAEANTLIRNFAAGNLSDA